MSKEFLITDEYDEIEIPRPDVIDTSLLYKVRVRFESPILGSKPMNKKIFEQYLASRNPNPRNTIEELQMLDNGILHVNSLLRQSTVGLQDEEPPEDADNTEADVMSSGVTGFLCDENLNPYLDAYLPKAMFKEAWTSRKAHPNSLSVKMKNGKSIISRHVFIRGTEPKRKTKLRLNIPNKEQVAILSRALRAETMQGPRTALAVSVILPKETWFEFYIKVLAPEIITSDHLHEWLSYGEYSGFGQFRGGNYGMFKYTLSRMDKKLT